jgi:hypothetical protein
MKQIYEWRNILQYPTCCITHKDKETKYRYYGETFLRHHKRARQLILTNPELFNLHFEEHKLYIFDDPIHGKLGTLDKEELFKFFKGKTFEIFYFGIGKERWFPNSETSHTKEDPTIKPIQVYFCNGWINLNDKNIHSQNIENEEPETINEFPIKQLSEEELNAMGFQLAPDEEV